MKVNEKEKKLNYLVEFVSANPTGPLHVGHCRGAIIGDVISNILNFNQHQVIKEYYVNDSGNQIISFTKSVYLRIREILNNEKFPTNDHDLYPGDYIIDIAKNIISENKNIKFENFNKISKELAKLSVNQSLKLIKIIRKVSKFTENTQKRMKTHEKPSKIGPDGQKTSEKTKAPKCTNHFLSIFIEEY